MSGPQRPDASHDVGPSGPDGPGEVETAPPPLSEIDRSEWIDPWRRLVAVAAALAVTAGLLTLLSVANAPRFSLLDEATHLDYVLRASEFEIPTTGQELAPETLERWSCRGQAMVDNLPACGSNAEPGAYPGKGQQYNAFHPPVYYAVTGIGARALTAVTGQDFMNSARAIGGAWLFAAMLGLYLTLRYWKVRWPYALCGALALATLPSVLHASSVVTNDAPAALGGVAALFVLGRVLVHRNLGWVLPALLTAAVVATKTMNALPLLTVAVVLALLAARDWRNDGRRAALPLARISIPMVAVAGFIHLGWTTMQRARTPSDYVSPIAGASTTPISGLPFDEWAPTVVGGLQMGKDFYLDPLVRSPYLSAWAILSTTLLAAASFVGLVLFERRSSRWYLSGTVLLGAFLYPFAVQFQALQGSRSFFHHLPTRYGMAFIPLGLAVLAMVAEQRNLRRTSVALVSIGVLAALSGASGIMT